MSEKKAKNNEPEKKRPSVRGMVKRIVQDAPEAEKIGTEAKEVFSSLWQMGDKARMEGLRLVAKEVRGYMEAMEIHKDLHNLLTNYSLEVTTSFRLKPLKKTKKHKRDDSEEDSDDA